MRPYHPALKRYIDYYYFQDSDFETPFSYQYFPNLHSTISVYKNSISCPFKGGGYIYPSRKPKFTKLLTTPVAGPKMIIQKGRVNKLAIVFFSHGLNYFIPRPVGKITSGLVSPLQGFDPSFDRLLHEVFEARQIETRVSILDQFFFHLLKSNVHPMFERARKLVEMDEKSSFTAIAEKLHLNRKSLYKWFRLFTNCSPEHYRNVAKFRASIHRKLNQPELLLSEIAHMHYADQSHFIKKVKQFTDLTPTHFFKKVERVGEMATFWSISKR